MIHLGGEGLLLRPDPELPVNKQFLHRQIVIHVRRHTVGAIGPGQ